MAELRRHANNRRNSDKMATGTDWAEMKSTNPADYQHVPRPVAAMPKTFEDGHLIETHVHDRDQFLFAIAGIMRIRTQDEAWIVPPDRAVYVPAGLAHSVSMRGNVDMRTLYIETGLPAGLPDVATVLEVSELLKALILALAEEPVLYDISGRGGAIARLILTEIARARALQFVIPMPRGPSCDKRLERLCSALLDNPSDPKTLDDWADAVGASPRTLARLFQRQVGMSFGLWRQKVRFHNAIEALMRNEPISHVALENGYRSTSAFTAAFRKSVGALPSAFRPS